MAAMSHSPRLLAASPPVLPTLSALTDIPSDCSRSISTSSPTQWLPIITRSARCAPPINCTSTGVPAGTLSTCWPIVMNPSTWLKAVTAPEPLELGYAASGPSPSAHQRDHQIFGAAALRRNAHRQCRRPSFGLFRRQAGEGADHRCNEL